MFDNNMSGKCKIHIFYFELKMKLQAYTMSRSDTVLDIVEIFTSLGFVLTTAFNCTFEPLSNQAIGPRLALD